MGYRGGGGDRYSNASFWWSDVEKGCGNREYGEWFDENIVTVSRGWEKVWSCGNKILWEGRLWL